MVFRAIKRRRDKRKSVTSPDKSAFSDSDKGKFSIVNNKDTGEKVELSKKEIYTGQLGPEVKDALDGQLSQAEWVITAAKDFLGGHQHSRHRADIQELLKLQSIYKNLIINVFGKN